jgi:hypothetical protein
VQVLHIVELIDAAYSLAPEGGEGGVRGR